MMGTMEQSKIGYDEPDYWNLPEKQARYYVKVEDYLQRERFFLNTSSNSTEEEQIRLQFASGIHDSVEDIRIQASQAMDDVSKGEKNYPAKLLALENLMKNSFESFSSPELLPALKRALYRLKGDILKRYADHIEKHDISDAMLTRRKVLYEQAVEAYIDADIQGPGKVTELGFKVNELFNALDDSYNALRLSAVLTLNIQLPVDPLSSEESAMME
jgi:hypothetical protein